jgi:rare lipoprotein A
MTATVSLQGWTSGRGAAVATGCAMGCVGPGPGGGSRARRRSSARRAGIIVAIAAAAVLAGCATAPKPPRTGGYYQHDGPPAQVPGDIMATPDAVPRIEPFHAFANRPYVALGRSYTPITDDRPIVQRGLASWYGRQFHGSRTSIGETYDMFAMTAAHPTMPLPSYARVTNLRSGASVIVRVNDRGPFRDGRVIDLSYAAAMRLGIAAAGTGEVEVERLTHARIAAAGMPAEPAVVPAVPADSAAAQAGAAPGWAVQLGAFEVEANAWALRERVASQLSAAAVGDLPPTARAPRVERDGALHRVLVGMLADRAAASELAARIAGLLGRDVMLLPR